MRTFQWSILTARKGKASRARLSSLISAVSIIFAFFICLTSGTQVYAADDPQSFEAPDNTAQAWVDVEATNVSAAGITGKMSDKTLTFKSSPSGVTAVIKTQAGAQNLVLQSQKNIDARLNVTFVDANNVILSEHSQVISLRASETPTPIPPKGDDDSNKNQSGNNAGSGSNNSNGNTNMPNGTVHHNQSNSNTNGNTLNVVKTGAAISGIAVLAIILAVTGIVAMRRKHSDHAQREA
uniref:hypothetical protein n=1 Tax=Bifidobacterium adolescentis TaxID=1680 RepID=UPI003FEDC57A